MFLWHGGKLPLCPLANRVCFSFCVGPWPLFFCCFAVASLGETQIWLRFFLFCWCVDLSMYSIAGTTAFLVEFLISLTCLYQFQDRASERHRPNQKKKKADGTHSVQQQELTLQTYSRWNICGRNNWLQRWVRTTHMRWCLVVWMWKMRFCKLHNKSHFLWPYMEKKYVIQRNLPGQRLGDRAWYECLRDFLSKELEFEFCNEQPCLARNKSGTIIIHVDDIMIVGSRAYWQDVFLKRMSEKFSISHSQLDGVGTSVSFLRRKVTDMGDWLMLTPGISISKVVKVFEESFGVARVQKIPCSAEIQMEDVSQKLNPRDATAYRSIVGLCLYLGRERPDLMFTIKELASGMLSPTLTGLQRLRKLVG